MRIGIPKETKTHEYRVGMTPASARELVLHGHEVVVQKGCGKEIGLEDGAYESAGATILDSAEEVFARADIVVKVKEPLAPEVSMLRENQVLFTYLHLAPDPELTRRLKDTGCIAVAYETVTDDRGGLPLLAPMSEVAGRMAIQAGAHCLELKQGGRGTLLSGVPGVPVGRVVVLGGGIVGTNAARMAMGLEAGVTVIDISLSRLYDLDLQFGPTLNTIYSTRDAIEEHVTAADLVVGAVLVPGAAAPRLVTEDMVRKMKRGSVVVDVAIDQGGCMETSRPTTHEDPTYVEHEVVHYCVTNMPGAVARTSTFALNNATLPFVVSLANKGVKAAMEDDAHLRNGLNIFRGRVTYEAVARDTGEQYVPPLDALAA